jgi:integrase
MSRGPSPVPRTVFALVFDFFTFVRLSLFAFRLGDRAAAGRWRSPLRFSAGPRSLARMAQRSRSLRNRSTPSRRLTSRPFARGAGRNRRSARRRLERRRANAERTVCCHASDLFNWAITEGVNETPFKRGSVSVVRLESAAESPRTRRLTPSVTKPDGTVEDGEEARLLKHANVHLRALIIAALSTGARLGELLSVQWSQIRRDGKGDAKWLELPAAKTNTATARLVPIGPRLRAELEMRRHCPDGQELGPAAYVLGTSAASR